MFETPKPDEKKLLARSIAFFKDPTDSVQKKRIAKIYRNGKEICVVAGHPQFAAAKKEEKERTKQEKRQDALDAKKLKQKKEQAAIVSKFQAVKAATEISEKQPVVAKVQDEKMQKEPQQKRKFIQAPFQTLRHRWPITTPLFKNVLKSEVQELEECNKEKKRFFAAQMKEMESFKAEVAKFAEESGKEIQELKNHTEQQEVSPRTSGRLSHSSGPLNVSLSDSPMSLLLK
ncbi:hypothetical protein AgCh_017047 [Apium graveolens]